MYMCLGVDITFLLDEEKDMLVATKRTPDTQHPGVYTILLNYMPCVNPTLNVFGPVGWLTCSVDHCST